MSAKCIWDAGCLLGEGPVWDPRDGLLYFVDIKGRALHRCDLDGDRRTSWRTEEPICWVIPRRSEPGFIAGVARGFATLTLAPFALSLIHAPEPERRTNRFNDAKADGRGRIWAGSMDDDECAGSGALYRFDQDLSCRRMDDGYCIANGPTFSPDGATLYHTDTAAKTIYAFEVAEDGSIGGKRRFVQFEDPSWGAPDGMTVDTEGGLWVAHWGGARVSRFTPEGALDRTIALPVAQVTSCVFAGEDLDRLFVTSAAIGRESEPFAGALFEVAPGARGLPPCAFAG